MEPLTFARFVALPENRAALLAAQQAAASVGVCRSREVVSPLFLHGPTGAGKTHLAAALVEEALRQAPDLIVTVLAARDLATWAAGEAEAAAEVEAARRCDLLVLEDLQHLPARAAEVLVQLLDALAAREALVVATATRGPGHLDHLPTRLTSRLAAGLVVGLEAPAPASRLALLRDRTQRRHLAVPPAVLAWLAEHLAGGRQLDGALCQLETLARQRKAPLDVETVARHFHDQAEAQRPTVERIAARVSDRFQVDPRQLRSRQRHRSVLLPRQVGMYLARRLTGLSLEQIGAYFGGRDHSTVLHACRKVEETLTHDATLSGLVRQLHAELG